ncbi:DEKNAAC103740 [Brettanomyces naardenensis]|uniref:DEKNAAC103740 n=1 Tax=Brettanomyces naardenensis TaxID=13370 RepID=A0A448YP12_BRENA|nr:DEKNAAC103740 [Brettanomyces naardenensis]
MTAHLINGKAISTELRQNIKDEISQLKKEHPDFQPKIVIVQVGERPDSSTYVRMKLKSCKEVGIDGTLLKFDAAVTQKELIDRLSELNDDSSVHGILVQLPLPSHIDEELITNAVKHTKDVDGFSELNMAAIFKRSAVPLQIPCTPKGILYMLDHEKVQISGKNVVVCGRSDIVGGPISKLLEKRGGTVTIVHSKTTPEQKHFYCSNADIIVSAVGKVNFLEPQDIKEGAVIIDVGTNYIPDSTKKSGHRLVGDVDFDGCKEKAAMITPVPGGVGPMTVVMVLHNLIEAAKREYGY